MMRYNITVMDTIGIYNLYVVIVNVPILNHFAND